MLWHHLSLYICLGCLGSPIVSRLETTSIKVIRKTVPRNSCSRRLLYLYFGHYMFHPSLAIIRWNTQYNIWRSYYSSFSASTETANIRQTQANCPYGGIGVLKTNHRHKTGQLNIKRPGSPEVRRIVPPPASARSSECWPSVLGRQKRGAS
jgi:hypothetical protein